jgi:hypothetical protein
MYHGIATDAASAHPLASPVHPHKDPLVYNDRPTLLTLQHVIVPNAISAHCIATPAHPHEDPLDYNNQASCDHTGGMSFPCHVLKV